MTSIAIFIDRAMLPGAHVVLLTALMHHGPETLDIHVFQSGLTPSETADLRRTLDNTGRPFRLTTVPFDPSGHFQRFSGLHGSQMTYGRLLLPELLPDHKKVLYLDADLLILTDLQRVFQTDLSGYPLGAVATATFEFSLDRQLASSRGIPGDAPHFNAGVLLFDLDQWRSHRLTNSCLVFAVENSSAMQSHDQSALNFVLRGRFKRLSSSLNVCVEPWNRDSHPGARILHFIGSPKPFDPGARWLHAHRRQFEAWFRRTASWRQVPPASRILDGVRRLWRTRRSIARCLFNSVGLLRQKLARHVPSIFARWLYGLRIVSVNPRTDLSIARHASMDVAR